MSSHTSETLELKRADPVDSATSETIQSVAKSHLVYKGRVSLTGHVTGPTAWRSKQVKKTAVSGDETRRLRMRARDV